MIPLRGDFLRGSYLNLSKYPLINEMLDGSGYPFGLKDGEISLPCRIMAIADIYDALAAADRPYKKAMPPEGALKILQEMAEKGLLDRDLVDLFSKKLFPGVALRSIYKEGLR